MKKKIMLVKDRNTLNCRWLCDFANQLSDKGYDVHVVCDSYKKAGENSFLKPQIKITNLSGKTKNPITNFWHKVRRHITLPSLRHAHLIKKEKPDLVIAYFPKDLYNIAFMQKYDMPIVLMVHGAPQMLFKKFTDTPIRKLIYSNLIKKIDVMHLLLDSFKSGVPECVKAKKEVVIANLVDQIPEKEAADLNKEKKKIVFVARLEPGAKRQHLLVEAFSRVAKQFPGWKVELWGEIKSKEYEQEVHDIAKKYGAEDQLLIGGYTKDVKSVYKNADIVGFPSAYEGFPLGLADGMAHGLPSVGFKTTPGVNEMIKDGHNGFLVDNVDEFSEKLALLMGDQKLRIKLGKNAREDMKAYSPENIIAQWDAVIKELTNK